MTNRITILGLCIFSIFTLAYSTHKISDDHQLDKLFFKGNWTVTQTTALNRHRFRRNLRPVEFDINGEKARLNLVLSKRNVFSPSAPIWLVKPNPGHEPNYTYELIKNRKDILDGDFYVDNENKAVILVRYDPKRKGLLYDGLFGEGNARHIIHSIPERSKTRRKRANEINAGHIIYNLPDIEDPINLSAYDSPSIIIERNGVLLDKLDKPLDTLYPKLLVVVDYHLFKLLKKDIAETIKYVATFWNIVDQKYARLDSPKVQIIISGVIIANDAKATNYIYRSWNESERADIDQMMQYTRTYFSQNFINDTGFKNYDAVIVMTGLKMKLLEGFFDISGLAAKLGGICTNQHNVAIVTDNGKYYNTLIATHELGHLLNLSHDFADECNGISYLFGPIKTSVMSSPTNGTEIFWSECSQRLLKEFATLKAAKCLESRYRKE